MKTLLLLLAGAGFLLFSCTKADVNTPANNNSTLSSNTVAASLKPQTGIQLLTAHPWMYNGYYFHYVNQSNKGDAQYVRGAANNIIDLTNTAFNFKKNGTFIEISDGYHYPSTWYFTNNANTVLVMAYSYGTDVNTVLTLSNSMLNYTRPSGYHNLTYTELIPAAKQ